MKILTIHSDRLEVELKDKAIDDVEDGEPGEITEAENTLVVFTAVEKGDKGEGETISEKAVEEIKDIYERVNADEVVIYPYAHLSSNLASSSTAKQILSEMSQLLEDEGIPSKRVAFGWYKRFDLNCKGHPLSELSRELSLEEKEKKEEEISEAEEDGKLQDIKVIFQEGKIKERYEIDDELVQRAIKSEMGELETGGSKPPHIDLMKRLELVENESRVSDSGNMRYYPKGQLIIDLMMDLGEKICTQELNGVKTRTPYIVDPNQENVKKMMEKFPERLYKVTPGLDGKDREFRLRPACDYGTWSMMKDMVISYKQLPIGLYEHDIIWRYEQSGELVGLNRLRNATMANFHTICKDTEEAFEEFERQVNRFAIKLYDYFGIDPEIVVLNCKEDFFKEHIETFKQWAESFGMPVIVKLFERMKTYKIAWVDVVAFDELKRPIEVDTVQLDTESSRWWDITYTSEENEEEYPLILHTGFGPERFLSAVLEDASAKENPILPLWLSPTQVRIIPVSSEKHMDFSRKVSKKLGENDIRVDIDDREESVGRRIRDSEKDWVPYTLVIGDREIDGDEFTVRKRESGEEIKMKLQDFIEEVNKRTEGFPYKPLNLPKLLSKRPKFYG